MFLIAVPQLGDPNFSKSVILVLQHDSEGAMGLMINSPTLTTIGQYAESQGLDCPSQISASPILKGGPVEPERGWILHDRDDIEEKKEILPGVYLSTTLTTLQELIEEGDSDFRLILGYAGWGEKQLENEMREGAWITTKADGKYIFETTVTATWTHILSDMGVDPARLMVGTGLH